MELWQSIILGIVQGLGEFLPISSSAHLAIAPWLLKFKDPGLAFDVALHFGTLIAVLSYFWKDWYSITSNAFASFIGNKNANPTQSRLFWYLVLATIPGAIIGKLCEHYAESYFRFPPLIALTLTLMGLILWISDKKSKQDTKLDDINLKQAMLIGFSQALAIIPGVSRSGVTITTALLLGLNRQAAARFSFLLSTPIIFGATLLKAKDFLNDSLSLAAIAGIIFSATFGLLSIKYMLQYIQKYSFKIFVYYRFAFALLIIAVYLLRRCNYSGTL